MLGPQYSLEGQTIDQIGKKILKTFNKKEFSF